eukprot:COSAG02_NODE_19125_length_898_cov_2.476846_1_plen_93_part_00
MWTELFMTGIRIFFTGWVGFLWSIELTDKCSRLRGPPRDTLVVFAHIVSVLILAGSDPACEIIRTAAPREGGLDSLVAREYEKLTENCSAPL